MQQEFSDAASIVRQARLHTGESQRGFARRMGSAQSLICKYERGEVSPPAKMLIQCMNLLEAKPRVVSTDDLSKLVKTRLSGAGMAPARQAVARLIHCFPAGGTQTDDAKRAHRVLTKHS